MPTQYEHIVPYSKLKSHEFENLVLLCSGHHQEVTAGRISKLAVKNGQAAPYCKTSGPAHWRVNLDPVDRIIAGSNIFRLRENIPIEIFRTTLGSYLSVTLRGGVPFYSGMIPSIRGGQFLKIDSNTISFNTTPYDARLSGKNFKILMGSGRVILHIFVDNGVLEIKQLRFRDDELAIRISEKTTSILNTETSGGGSVSGCEFMNIGLIFTSLKLANSGLHKNLIAFKFGGVIGEAPPEKQEVIKWLFDKPSSG